MRTRRPPECRAAFEALEQRLLLAAGPQFHPALHHDGRLAGLPPGGEHARLSHGGEHAGLPRGGHVAHVPGGGEHVRQRAGTRSGQHFRLDLARRQMPSEGSITITSGGVQPMTTGVKTGSNNTDATYTTAYDPYVYTPITISGAPTNAYINSVTVNWNVDSNYTSDIQYYIDMYGTRDWYTPYYWMTATGDDPGDTYSETSNSSMPLFPPVGVPVNGIWYFNVWDVYDDADPAYNRGRIDSWSITINYTTFPDPFSAWFWDVRTQSTVDTDGDGYWRQFDLQFDVDSTAAGTYYVKVYKETATGHDFLVKSSNFSVSGIGTTDWRTRQIVCDTYGLGHGKVNLVLELYNAANDQLLQTWTGADDDDLYSIGAELSTQDVASNLPAVTTFNLNSGATTTTSQTVTLNNTATKTPTHYMASERADFQGASWFPYATAPSFTLSPGSGSKVVYFKVKNATGESPEAMRDDIYLTSAATTVDLSLYRISDTTGTPNTDSPGAVVTSDTFMPGQTVRVTLKATNSGTGAVSRAVQTSLAILGPDNTAVVYDSHAAGQDNSADSPLAAGETDYYSFDWTLPAGAAPGAYDLVGSIRSLSDYGTIFDTTASGAGTVDLGTAARLREKFWVFQDTPLNRTSADTSEYLAGKVWVNVILPSSTGGGTTEDWSVQEIANVRREVEAGVRWWATTLPDANLEFGFDWTYADSPVVTTYEPIARPSYDEDLWIDSVMAVVAPGIAGADYMERVTSYDDLTRRASGSDWAYTVFVVDDSNDPDPDPDYDHDHMFSDGYFAYSYLGGPFTVMTYNNDSWGIDDMEEVMAHEMGHIFYALDEYSGGDFYTARSGYFNTQNLNAYDGNPNPATRVDSAMCEPYRQDKAYANHTSSTASKEMVGYRDTDGDGRLDILDTDPSVTTAVLSSNPATGAIRIQATGAVVPLANQNPNSADPPARAISLNRISAIQYRLDAGPWQSLPAEDGTYDEDSETAVVDLANLSGGNHHVYFRSQSTVGRWELQGNLSAAADVPFDVNQPTSENWAGAGTAWHLAANWSGGVVPGPETVVVFDGAPTVQPALSQDETVKGVVFLTAGWTLGGAGALAVGTGGIDSAGSGINTISRPVAMTAASTWTVGSDNTLVLGGALSGSGYVLTKDGPGTLRLPQSVDLAGLAIDAGTVAGPDGGGPATIVTHALSIAQSGGSPTATLDLAASRMVIDYDGDPNSSPLEEVKAWIQAGWFGPDAPWYGTGIISTVARGEPNLYTVALVDQGRLLAETGELWYGPGGTRGETFGGIAVDWTSILVKFTYLGDVDLDGKVYDDDVGIMSGNYTNAGPTGAQYWNGDVFGFDGWVYDDEAGIIGGAYNNGRLYGPQI